MKMEDLAARKELLAIMVAVFTDPNSEELESLGEMREEVEYSFDFWLRAVEGECPIAFKIPSLEQAMVLNSWHPNARTEGFQDIDQSRVPDFLDYEGDYQSIGNFTSNRGGKTFVSVWDTVMWLIPYDPSWKMFEWRDDWLGRGRYRVLPRPDWELWHNKRKLRYHEMAAPPKGACTIWHGIGRDDDWSLKVYPAYRILIPKQYVGIRSDGQEAVFRMEKRIETSYNHQIIGMSIAAKASAWSGKECFRLNMDEGICRAHLDEGLTRLMGGGTYHQAFTPAEPANIGEMSMVAKKMYDGDPAYKPPGKCKFFVHFRLEDVPPWIIDNKKKQDDLKRFEAMGEAGKPRMHGGFVNSSPVVFTNFKRAFHVLPWSSLDIVRAIRGELLDQPWAEQFVGANIIRAYDPGMASPSAVVWGALLRTGEIVYYRDWEKSGISISARCEAIIEQSGNKRIEVVVGKKPSEKDKMLKALLQSVIAADVKREKETGVKLPRYREKFVREHIRKTLMDHKEFRKDPNYPLEDASMVYHRAGLKVERSTSLGPAARCQYLDDLLRPEPNRHHLNPMQGEIGARAYASKDCRKLIERFENYLHEQRKDGSFTDQPVDEDDHTIDAACSVCCANLRWTDMSAKVNNFQIAA